MSQTSNDIWADAADAGNTPAADPWSQADSNPPDAAPDDAFDSPYEHVFSDTSENWVDGPTAVITNEAEIATPGAGKAEWVDPYSAAPPETSDHWVQGPDAVQVNEALAAGPGDLGGAADAAVPAPDALADPGFALHQLWDGTLPVQDWINHGLGWFVAHFRPFFQGVRGPVDQLLSGVDAALHYPPPLLMIGLLTLLAWQLAGGGIGLTVLGSLLVVAMLGIWSEAMVTLSLVLTSLLFCIVIGLPLGIWLARSDRAEKLVRPVLDAMQTTPAFVYLVPVVMLLGIGNVPGVIVTIIFALAPLVRLTNLGIRQVRPDLVEAARAYGASPWQLLLRVQLPLAMPSIMTGINQSLMLSLSMVVIASMIAVGGLGLMVLRGIGRLDMGLATVGGIGIVILAIVLDRLTQAMGKTQRKGQRWYMRGPAGLLWRLLPHRQPASGIATPAAHAPLPAAPTATSPH